VGVAALRTPGHAGVRRGGGRARRAPQHDPAAQPRHGELGDTLNHAEWLAEVLDTYCMTLGRDPAARPVASYLTPAEIGPLLDIKEKLGLPDLRLAGRQRAEITSCAPACADPLPPSGEGSATDRRAAGQIPSRRSMRSRSRCRHGCCGTGTSRVDLCPVRLGLALPRRRPVHSRSCGEDVPLVKSQARSEASSNSASRN